VGLEPDPISHRLAASPAIYRAVWYGRVLSLGQRASQVWTCGSPGCSSRPMLRRRRPRGAAITHAVRTHAAATACTIRLMPRREANPYHFGSAAATPYFTDRER